MSSTTATLLKDAWSDFYAQRHEEVRTEIVRRIKLSTLCKEDKDVQAATLELCSRDPVMFFNDWIWGYDSRNIPIGLPASTPFILRPRQIEYVRWLEAREENQEDGIVEKSREEGFSYLTLGYFLHHWLFQTGFSAVAGSYKEDKVDKLDNPDCLLWKFRDMLYRLPGWMRPEGFSRDRDDNFMRIVNRVNGCTMKGEVGKNMGRGGRATIFLIDEWAHVETQESVEMATSETSRVRIKGSTPFGIGDRFYQDRHSGKHPVFTFNWRDNPDKNWTADVDGETVYPWYEKQKEKKDAVTLAQEVDIDYAASAEGVVIQGRWIQAALQIELAEGTKNVSGLDVSEDGGDRTIYANRRGGVVTRLEDVHGTPSSKGHTVIEMTNADGAGELFYDRLGVGAGITSSVKDKEDDLPFKVAGVANSEKPTPNTFEDQPKVLNTERFNNAAAENWWALRLRFFRTWERVELGVNHADEDCVSLPNDSVLIAQLAQPTYTKNSKDKIVVNKHGNGTQSPDRAEAVMYAFWIGKPEVDYARGPF